MPVAPKGCEVRPTVLAGILDAFVRRPTRDELTGAFNEAAALAHKNAKKGLRGEARKQVPVPEMRKEQHPDIVHGILLGAKHGGKFFVEDAFAVPRLPPAPLKPAEESENDSPYGLDERYVWKMLDLHRRINPKVVAIGWYTAGSLSRVEGATEDPPEALGEPAALMHEFFLRQLRRSPVHVVVDTTLVDSKLDIKAFRGTTIVLAGTTVGAQFSALPASVVASPEESAVIQSVLAAALSEDGEAGVVETKDALLAALKRLSGIVTDLKGFSESAGADTDPAIGRAIVQALDSVPELPSEQLEKLVDAASQDAMLVVYLANMARAQIKLAEKLARVVV